MSRPTSWLGASAYSFGLLLMFCLSSTRCVMSRATGEHLETELKALRHDVGTLERRLSESDAHHTEAQGALRTQMVTLGQNVDKESAAARRATAEMGTQIEQVVQDVQLLRGSIEDTAHSFGEAQLQQSKVAQDLMGRIAQLQTSSAPAPRERALREVVGAVPKGKKEALQYGQKLLGAPNTQEDGRAVLRELSRKYAKERGIGDEALYLLAQSYVQEKKYAAAQRDLIKLVDVAPKSPRVPDAFLALASCSEAQGNLEDAQTFYSEVVNNHRRSPAARLAQTRLERLVARSTKKPARAP